MAGLADYAGWLYGQPGMQTLLLELQDEAGQDVLLMLSACWLGRQQREAEPQLWQELHAAQRPWRERVIQPLRQVRRGLAGNPDVAALYEQVKACELAAEWHQLTVLERLCAGAAGTGQAPRDCVLAHLARCCGSTQDVRLHTLASAALAG
ncbi:TIGR02444 family protein [Halopseudomonas pertucinogena]|uniref:TIGR02444 family protein n=1 Tax=Halopseudomonas pertucinogena TaxID=86175 RepID=A0ABQ2CR34_9GAMM|nr:TIGR02444 family protein [Halopseudomonas pertucinogena]GGJ04765.1 hypothetical protein GCM10009083_22050 [Halopseudomonas pertucinogena]